MRRIPAILLQALLVALGGGALAFLLWEPQVEGVNAHATLLGAYLDPFVLFAYTASIPFFVLLYQAFPLAASVGPDRPFPPDAVRRLRTIRRCALVLLAFVAASLLFLIHGDPDDHPAGVFLRLLVAVPASVVALTAARFARTLRSPSQLPSDHPSST